MPITAGRQGNDAIAAASPPSAVGVKRPPGARAAGVVLIAAAVAGVALRGWGTGRKRVWTGDEASFYVTASGHLAEFVGAFEDGAPPAGRWVAAHQWKRLWKPNEPLCFGRIARDVATWDVHAPLYLWLLHLWTLLVGAHTWAGPALNCLIDAIAAVILFALASRALRSRLSGALAVLIWAISPAVVVTSLVARYHSLLALFTVFLADQALRLSDPRQPLAPGRLPLVFLATIGLLLTNYYGPIILLACGMIVLFRLWRANRRRLLAGLCTVAAAVAFCAIVNPFFPRAFANQRGQHTAFELAAFAARVRAVLRAVNSFFLWSWREPIVFTAILLAGAAAFIAAAAWAGRRRQKALSELLRRAWPPEARRCALLMLLMLLPTAGLYLAFKVHPKAMSHQHLVYLWPFAAVLAAGLLRLAGRREALAGAVLCAAMLATSAYSTRELLGSQTHDPAGHLAKAGGIVIDNPHCAFVPPLLLSVPDQTPVFAWDQRKLAAEPERWVGRFGEGVYASRDGYRASDAGRRRVLAHLAGRTQGYLAGRKAAGFHLYFIASPREPPP